MTSIQFGDVIQLGRHRLACSDAFDAASVDILMDGAKADMLYCDPPYGIKLDTNGPKRQGSKYAFHGAKAGFNCRRNVYPPVVGDDTPFDPSPLFERFAQSREQFWWGADYYAERLPKRNAGCWIVWDKRPALEGDSPMDRVFGSSFELCWSRQRHHRRIVRCLWSGVTGMRPVDGKRFHPTQKPVRLAEWFIEHYSQPGANIMDLFAGSGSTLLACERTDRTAYCMEISPEYSRVIIDRWQDMTGQQAVIVNRNEAAA